MKVSHEGRKRAVGRKLGIEELLTRPLKPNADPRRLPRSMPGMRDWLTHHNQSDIDNWYKVDGKARRLGKSPLLSTSKNYKGTRRA